MRDDSADTAVSTEDVSEIAARLGVTLPDPEAVRDAVDGTLAETETLASAPSLGPGRADAERSGADAEDEYNAWTTRCRVSATEEGPLAGRRVGVKDNLALAGFPMTCGSRALRFEPEIDATAVARLLRAGATVVGKTNMDAFAFGGTGDLQEFGATLNPADPDYIAGGSSSGSAAAVAAGECDIGVATDQAGSVRGPSAWCGCVGMKPTHGLVPYTGGFSTDRSLDHLGFITRSVGANARALGVAAGPDLREGTLLDPRQSRRGEGGDPERYVPEDADLDGLTVGVVEDGFGRSVSEAGVDGTVREGIDALVAAGASTRTVSLPELELALPLMDALVALSVTAGPFEHGGVQAGAGGWHWTRLAEEVRDLVEERPDELPVPVALLRVIGDALAERGRTVAYADGKNAMLAAERRLARRFESCDVLALPTTPMTAFEHAELPWMERVARNADVLVNTAVFDHTGHPALTVPCGGHGGLPVGLQLVGPHFAEARLYRVAAALD
jgi:amidase